MNSRVPWTFMTKAQREFTNAVLERIIPREGSRPSASEEGTDKYIERLVGSSEQLKLLFTEGLSAIDFKSHSLYSKNFLELSIEDKDNTLRKVESDRPDFFVALVANTYRGYYSNPQVLKLLGLEVTPPQPIGYELEPFDPALLTKVKKRGKVYRDV